jgi:hypothetical protein
VQQADNQWPGQNANGDSQSLTNSVTLPSNVTVGNSLVVFVANYNLGGVGGTVTLSDNLGHTYAGTLRRVDDDNPNDNMSLYVFCLPRITTSGSLTLTATYPQLEWHGLFVMEVSGLISSPVLATASNVATANSTTANSLNAGTLAAGAHPGIIFAICLNGTDGNASLGGGVGAPSIGTGYTACNAGITNWNGEENSFVGPACATEYKVFTSNIGTVTPSFTPKKSGEGYVGISIALASA